MTDDQRQAAIDAIATVYWVGRGRRDDAVVDEAKQPNYKIASKALARLLESKPGEMKRYDAACRALAEAKRVDEVKNNRDLACGANLRQAGQRSTADQRCDRPSPARRAPDG
jgi:hypothetical protein